MATGLVDKLHLALEQVKKKNNLGVEFSWQSICLNSAKEHSTAGATQICVVLPLSPTAEKGAKTRLHMAELSGCPAHCVKTVFTFSPPQRVQRGPMFHQHFTQTAPSSTLPPPTAMPHRAQGNGSSLFHSFLCSLKAVPTRKMHGTAASVTALKVQWFSGSEAADAGPGQEGAEHGQEMILGKANSD